MIGAARGPGKGLMLREGRGRRRGLVALVAGYASFGAFWGTWAVVFTDFLSEHGLSPGDVSVPFTLLSAIAILVMTFVAPRLEPVPRGLTLALALSVHAAGAGLLAVLPAAWLMAGFAVIGVGTGLVDVTVNAAAHDIEVRAAAPVLQWVHASYGAGGVVASLAAGAAITLGATFAPLLLAAAALQLAAAAAARGSTPLGGLRGAPPARGTPSLTAFVRAPFLLIPALVVASAFFVEGSMDVWSVIFLRRTLGATALTGAAGFAAFALATAVGRAFAAGVLFRGGSRRTIVLSGMASLVAGLAAVLTSSPLVAGAAFLALGFALSAAAPAAYGMAGETRVAPGLAVAAITTVGYAGFVVGPPVMGWLADAVGLRATMAALVVATLGIVLGGAAARVARPAAAAEPAARG